MAGAASPGPRDLARGGAALSGARPWPGAGAVVLPAGAVPNPPRPLPHPRAQLSAMDRGHCAQPWTKMEDDSEGQFGLFTIHSLSWTMKLNILMATASGKESRFHNGTGHILELAVSNSILEVFTMSLSNITPSYT